MFGGNSLLPRLRHWLSPRRLSAPAPVPFEVACACGRKLAGSRTPTHQILPCPSCGDNVFVLPLSAWLATHRAAGQPLAGAPGFRPRDWLLPVLGSALALALLVLTYLLWLGPWLRSNDVAAPAAKVDTRAELLQRWQNARTHLADGQFRLAWNILANRSNNLPMLDLSSLSPAEQRDWRQLQAEAGICADLLAESLEEVVRHAAGTREQEWNAEFPLRYQGKSVLLDADFQVAPNGLWKVLYPLYLGKERVRLVVDDVKVLRCVPSHGTQRLVLGLRLAHVKLEAPGPTWVVRFQPDSGVLLTDPAMQRLCPPLADQEGQAVLARQKQWLEDCDKGTR